ncbi:MAG: ATP-dependent helicase [Brevinematia bacterium]
MNVLEDLLTNLDEDQKVAVSTTEGPLLVIAGPGSGKTRVITYRFAYIILSKKALPQQILCLTFTNKAANEMKNRVKNLTQVPSADSWWIKTFHSLGLSIIKENYEHLELDKNFVIYDKEDQLKLIKSITKKLNFNELSPENLMEIIDNIRYNNNHKLYGEKMEEFTEIYERELRKNNAVDFVDLIKLPFKLLKENKEIREIYKRRWKYIMVDEFQDTDPIQYELVKLILNEEQNICVVGDDDQSIYGWRGANVENIRNFDKDFKNCKVVILKTNYRSTEEIIKLSNSISSGMLFRRKEKVIKGTGNFGSKPIFIETIDQSREADIIVKIIKELTRKNYQYKDIAILYRANYLSRLIEEKLVKENIPYRIYSGFSFFERAEIKDILAYLKLYINPHDNISFSRIINVPKRGIGPSTLSNIIDYATKNSKDFISAVLELHQKGILKNNITSFVNAFRILSDETLRISEKLKKLLEEIKYYDYLISLKDDYEDRIENVEELIRAVEEFEEDSENPTIEEFIEHSTLRTNSDDISEENNTISLMTLHVSKGLEFPVIFIYSAADGIIPHFKNTHSSSLLDEERRLFYVGITRAKELLYITSSRFISIGSIRHNFVNPSRFIDEIPESYIELIRY